MQKDFFDKLTEKIQPFFIKGGSHAFDHTQRVQNISLKLSKDKKVDLDVIKAASLLHDIARVKEDKNECECHAKYGSEMAEKILKEMNFPEDKIKKVVYAIKVHRHSAGIKAESIEAQILQDADRLDALGAITVARMFSTGGETNRPLHDPKVPLKDLNVSTIHGFYSKILKITPDSFNTELAKVVAKERFEFVKKYLEQFFKEWDGKDIDSQKPL